MTARKASPTAGSNCVAAQARSSSQARSREFEQRTAQAMSTVRKPPKPKTRRGIEPRLRRTSDDGFAWRFRVRWTDGNGRRLVEELETVDDALEFQAQLRLARRRGTLEDLDRGSE